MTAFPYDGTDDLMVKLTYDHPATASKGTADAASPPTPPPQNSAMMMARQMGKPFVREVKANLAWSFRQPGVDGLPAARRRRC
jgi:hypothetical protein